jgi:hypothetical protein
MALCTVGSQFWSNSFNWVCTSADSRPRHLHTAASHGGRGKNSSSEDDDVCGLRGHPGRTTQRSQC